MWLKLKMFLRKKWVKISLISLGCLFLVCFILAFLLKDWFLHLAIEKAQAKLKREYGITLTIKKDELIGFSVVKFSGVKATSNQNKTLFELDKTGLEVSLWHLLAGDIFLNRLYLEKGFANLDEIKKLKKLTASEAVQGDTTNFGKIKRYLNLFEELMGKIPEATQVKNFALNFHDSDAVVSANLTSLLLLDERLTAKLDIKVNNQNYKWKAEGDFAPSTLITHVVCTNLSKATYPYAFIRKIFKSDVNLNRMAFNLESFENEEALVKFNGSVSGEELTLYSDRLSDDTIKMDKGIFNFKVEVNPKYVLLDSASSLTMNKLTANIGCRVDLNNPKTVALSFNMKPVPASELLKSMPAGIMNKEKDMVLDGMFSYKLHFFVNLTTKDTAHIDSDLDGISLRILDFGSMNLNKIKSSFTYIPYNSSRKIVVGSDNPDFVPLENISPYLRAAVNISEDGGYFFAHRGFNQDATERSFCRNLQTGNFSRGGSTITMQLIKNVFLSHKKKLDRKIEEAFLTWLMENKNIVSKNRMLEVYLNIIEWGPNIYGVAEACRFYFDKKPSDLTLNEAIFLSIIIPQPRAYKHFFAESGHLKEGVKYQYNLIGAKMKGFGYITGGALDSLYPDVWLGGPARQTLTIKADSMQLDSNLFENLEFIEPLK